MLSSLEEEDIRVAKEGYSGRLGKRPKHELGSDWKHELPCNRGERIIKSIEEDYIARFKPNGLIDFTLLNKRITFVAK